LKKRDSKVSKRDSSMIFGVTASGSNVSHGPLLALNIYDVETRKGLFAFTVSIKNNYL
jgi:hypothetical protein